MEFFSGLIRVISLLIAVDAWFPNQSTISENRYWITTESSYSTKHHSNSEYQVIQLVAIQQIIIQLMDI